MIAGRIGSGGVAVAWLLVAPGTVSCDAISGSAPPCTTGLLGSASQTPKLEIIAVQPDDSVAPVVDGGTVALLTPPQGGRVLFVGARALNVDGCGLQLTGALRDPASGQVKVEVRTVDLVRASDGWGVSGVTLSDGIANFSNLAPCPNQTFATAVEGNPFELEVAIVDHEGRMATQSLTVTPYCGEPSSAAYCACICAAHYTTDKTCPVGDGG